jgi:hypothetical protein
MPFKPEEFAIFTKIDKTTFETQLGKINRYLQNFSRQTGIADITTHSEAIYQVIERVEKRRVYFHIFYNGCKMGELNESALICFWILKLMPFFCPSVCNTILNAKIALCIFTNALYMEARTTGKKVNP